MPHHPLGCFTRPVCLRLFMAGGMGTSAVGAMSASTNTTMAMATGVVVETIVAMVVTDGPLARGLESERVQRR